MAVAVYMQVDRFFPPEIIQRTAIQKWLAQNNIQHSSVQWFIDREAKTEFKQMLQDINNKSIHTVVMYSLEQAFTSIKAITAAIDDFASKNITFASVSQNIHFNQDSIRSAHSLLTVVLTLADHHKQVRQQLGIEKAKVKGLYKGKKPGANKKGVDIKKAVLWYKRGWQIKRIAEKLGVCQSSVFRYIRISKGK